MVQTRRSLSKSPVKETSNSTSHETPRSRRRQTRGVLRSQSTGVGISIHPTTKDTTQPKKIVFDEEGNAPLEHEQAMAVVTEPVRTWNANGSENDNDDDAAVEEIKGSDAKTQMQEQRTIERSTARESTALRGGQKRKRKPKIASKENDETMMDEDFFQQLDAEMEQDKKKESSQDNSKKKPQGKLITFVAKDEALQNRVPIQKEHNLQIVVLNDDNVKQAAPPAPLVGAPPSTAYSRFHVNNGMDEPSAKQLQKAKKTGRKTEETWTRSNKVTQKLLGTRRMLQPVDDKASLKKANRTIVIRL